MAEAPRDEPGQLEGERCNRMKCEGIIAEAQVEGCTCFRHPPCSACMTPREHCPKCDWRAVDDEVPFNGFLVRPANPSGAWASYRPRPLDPTKIDYRSSGHTHFSMVKEGVYPQSGDPEADRSAVLEAVKGTFGGRFEYFGNGRFKYVAYTD